jgi:hypothetical protein
MNAVEIHFAEIMLSTPSLLGNTDTARNIVKKFNIVVCIAADIQQLRDGRIYQGRFWATAR